MPNKLQELIIDYDTYAKENGVIELPLDYEWAAEMTTNTFKRNYLPLVWRTIFLILSFLFIVILIRRRWKS